MLKHLTTSDHDWTLTEREEIHDLTTYGKDKQTGGQQRKVAAVSSAEQGTLGSRPIPSGRDYFVKLTAREQAEIDTLVAKLVVETNSSIRFTESRSFKRLLAALKPQYVVPGQYLLRTVRSVTAVVIDQWPSNDQHLQDNMSDNMSMTDMLLGSWRLIDLDQHLRDLEAEAHAGLATPTAPELHTAGEEYDDAITDALFA
jgi:hypothetical protein